MTVVCKEQRLNYKDECVQLRVFIKCVTCHFLQTVNVGVATTMFTSIQVFLHENH